MVLVVDQGCGQPWSGQTACCQHGDELAGRAVRKSMSQTVAQGAPSTGLWRMAATLAIWSCLIAGDGRAEEQPTDTADLPLYVFPFDNILNEAIAICICVVVPLTFIIIVSRYFVYARWKRISVILPTAKPEALSVIIALFSYFLCVNFVILGLASDFQWFKMMEGFPFLASTMFVPYVYLCFPVHFFYLLRACRSEVVYRTSVVFGTSVLSVILEYVYLCYLNS
jgi:hypothetical protein